MAYLTLAEFKLLTIAPPQRIEDIEDKWPGWFAAQLEHFSEAIDDRLRKRYATPFATPAPRIVRMWLTQLVTPRVYLKGGIDATDEQFTAVEADAQLADKQIEAAANAQSGLYELPLRSDAPGAAGISRGGPKFYTQNSPYAARDENASWAKQEDANRYDL
jgi:hypothetical protein